MIDRSTPEFREFLELYQTAPLLELGSLADQKRQEIHPEGVVTYIVDREAGGNPWRSWRTPRRTRRRHRVRPPPKDRLALRVFL